MNTFIDSYAAFFTVFISMYVLAFALDWISSKYNLKLHRCFSAGGNFFSDQVCETNTENLQSRVEKLEDEVGSLRQQGKF